jgi:hypothetical protein
MTFIMEFLQNSYRILIEDTGGPRGGSMPPDTRDSMPSYIITLFHY